MVEDGAGQRLDPAMRASRIRELAKNVSIDLLGNDFIEFRLAGPSAKGLGDRLQTIMANLIGALVAPPGETAGQFALRALTDKLRDAEARVTALDAQIAGLLPSGLETALAQVADQQKLDTSIREQLASLSASAKPDGGAPSAGGGTQDARKAMEDQLAEVSADIDNQNRRIAVARVAQAERDDLAGSLGKLRASVDDAKARLGSEPATVWGAMINAPERMIVVDPPRDPELRTTSRLYLVASGALGGVLLGIALVVLAEILDITLRTPEQMLAVAGVPCLGSLPLLSAKSRGVRSAVETARDGVGLLLYPKARLELQQTPADG